MKMKFKLVEDFQIDEKTNQNTRTQELISIYKDLARVPKDKKLTEKEINPEILDRVSENFACSRATLKEALLAESAPVNTVEDKVTLDDLNDEEEVDEVIEALDDALYVARSKHSKRINVRLLGRAGFGKSEIVDQWARKNNIHLYEIDLSTITGEFFGGIPARDSEDPNATRQLPPKKLIDTLSIPNTVLFLDEYNRARDSVRAPLHNLLTKYRLADEREPSGWKDFRDTLLFCVAAANQTGGAYRGAKPFEASENTRFIDPKVSDSGEAAKVKNLKYFKSIFTDIMNDPNASEEERKAAKGKLALATKLLTDENFKYTTEEEEEDNIDEIQRGTFKPLNFRSLHYALELSRGKKDLLLKKWGMAVTKDKLGMIQNILTDYVDIDDKATQALEDPSESEVFAKTKLNMDKIKAKFPNIDF